MLKLTGDPFVGNCFLVVDHRIDLYKGGARMSEFQNVAVADWWYYDATKQLLYCEVKQDDKPTFVELECLITDSGVGNAWLAISTSTGQQLLLWEDKELSPEKELVAEVENWSLAVQGNYKEGASFEDVLRLFIPLKNGAAIGIGKSRERHYYLVPNKHQ